MKTPISTNQQTSSNNIVSQLVNTKMEVNNPFMDSENTKIANNENHMYKLRQELRIEAPNYIKGQTKFKNPVIKFRSAERIDILATKRYHHALQKLPCNLPGRKRSNNNMHVDGCTCPKCKKKRHLAKTSSKHQPKLAFKMNSSGIPLVKSTLHRNGFVSTKKDNWNLYWTSSHLKSYFFQGLNKYQKVNQFPRSYEITRKDSLLRNISRMQSLFGIKNFDFVPRSFILPKEASNLQQEMKKYPDKSWIVKPATAACGRGIFVTQSFEDVSRDAREDNYVCVQYISNPLLVDGLKFDLRLYVVVTSYKPLRIYLYEEGLARFATEAYDSNAKSFGNRFMHLTNYSVNKHSANFIETSEHDSGTKWSLTSLKKKLIEIGIDANLIFEQVNDVIIKTLLSIESQVIHAQEMFVPYPESNCFELFGFDILVDDDLKPWLLEVNFSPSLNVDGDIDLDIKSDMLADMFTLVGITPYDMKQDKDNYSLHARSKLSLISNNKNDNKNNSKITSSSNPRTKKDAKLNNKLNSYSNTNNATSQQRNNNEQELTKLSLDNRRIVIEATNEFRRRGSFKRIFPTMNAYRYKPFFEEERAANTILSTYLFRCEYIAARRNMHQCSDNNNISMNITTNCRSTNDATATNIELKMAVARRRHAKNDKKIAKLKFLELEKQSRYVKHNILTRKI